MLLGWVPIQVVLKLLQVLADSVAQSIAISIVGHVGQVSLFTGATVAQKLLQAECLFEVFGPVEVMDLCVPSDPYNVQTLPVLQDGVVFGVQDFPVHMVTCQKESSNPCYL